MIADYLEIIEGFLPNTTEHIERGKIEQKANELGVVFPESMIEFYEFFGNNNEVLNAYFQLKKLDKFEIQNDSLVFGFGHQDVFMFGILLNQMSLERPQIQKYVYDMKRWYVESSSCHRFFLNVACWQVLNTMPCVATIEIKEKNLDSTLEGKLSIISKERPLYKSYDIYSYYNKEKRILACYVATLQDLYVASNDESYLEEFEAETSLALDWA